MIDNTTWTQQVPTRTFIRHYSVSAESFIPGQRSSHTLLTRDYPMTAAQRRRLLRVLEQAFLFSSLDQGQYLQVADAFIQNVIANVGTEVIKQGDDGEYFHIVEKGSLDFYVKHEPSSRDDHSKGKKEGSASAGDYFGELALLYNAPRAATVVSAEPECVLWALDGESFRRIVAESSFARRRLHESFLESVPLLSTLTASQWLRVAEALETRTYAAGETIIRQGDPGTSFFLLVSGEAHAYQAGFPGSVMHHRGSFFGERAFRKNTPRAASIITVTDVIVVTLERQAFSGLLGPGEEIMRRTAYVGITNDEEEPGILR
ncbi:cyclic nucleotide-binding-like protein [Aspergillus keveii]|uniref:cAMP-dependent protein kinase regulatory subunit n=1 Tax=Aspergillus keveii TaxID=714993 RepID=A0ABR4FTX1_9EURO